MSYADHMKNDNKLVKDISWQVGFAWSGVKKYREIGCREMVEWNKGRLGLALHFARVYGFDKEEAYKAFKKAQ